MTEAEQRSAVRVPHGTAAAEVLRVALPLMVSTGTFSLVLFIDRTFLLWFNGESMSASMAGGNLFWSLVCVPVGVVSMTGATIGQYAGANRHRQIGRFLWQATWISLATIPVFGLVAWFARDLFVLTGQPPHLHTMEAAYLRLLMAGAPAVVLEAGWGGFFAGTQRTPVIMWTSVASGLINVLLDWLFIFGVDWGRLSIPAMGIEGAGWASTISFWFKPLVYAVLLASPKIESLYQWRAGFGWDFAMARSLVFFGLPAGLMSLAEAGGFTAMMLAIGRIDEVSLRATTMAINFNMIAFIPLIGLSIATSVLVGTHLLESGPRRAIQSVVGALAIGWGYSLIWAVIYLALPARLLSLYTWQDPSAESLHAIGLAEGLLGFVAIYLLADATQLITAGALRGAGDTWFVLLAGAGASTLACGIGILWEPASERLNWWWWVMTCWVFLLALSMTARFLQGRWKHMRMIEEDAPDVLPV